MHIVPVRHAVHDLDQVDPAADVLTVGTDPGGCTGHPGAVPTIRCIGAGAC